MNEDGINRLLAAEDEANKKITEAKASTIFLFFLSSLSPLLSLPLAIQQRKLNA
jgi:hypothetical protein